MSYEVVAVGDDYVEIWDGKTKDEWLNKSTIQFHGAHMHDTFRVGQRVNVILQVAAEAPVSTT